jgi:hypothetical protein
MQNLTYANFPPDGNAASVWKSLARKQLGFTTFPQALLVLFLISKFRTPDIGPG